MKKNILRMLGWVLVSSSLFAISCTDNDDTENPENAVDVMETEFEINGAFEDTDNVTLEVLQSSGLGLRTSATYSFCESADITHNVASKQITVDFGTGCTASNGTVRSGKFTLTYSGTNFLLPGTSVVTTFEDYTVDGVTVNGTRTLTNTGIDLANSTVTLAVKVENGEIAWTDGSSVTYTSTQVRQLKVTQDGYESSITGTASGKSKENKNYTVTITDPLISTQACLLTGVYIPSKGMLELVYGSVTVSADYGDGTCDKKVMITYPGGTKEVTVD